MRDEWVIKAEGPGITCELVPSSFATHVTEHENLIIVTKHLFKKNCQFSSGHDLDDARMYGWNFDTKGKCCFIFSIYVQLFFPIAQLIFF